MRSARNFQSIPDLQAGVVEPPTRLAWLDPNRAPNPCRPLSTGLVGRFVNVATATQEWLRVLDEARNGRRTNPLAVPADVHPQVGGRTMDQPDAALDFVG